MTATGEIDERAEIARLCDGILKEDRVALGRYFTENKARLVSLVWQPEEAALANPALAHMLAYWNRLRGSAALPDANAVSPHEMKPALGHLLLVDIVDDGWDGRFRLYGTRIAEMYGRDMTGRRVSEMTDRPYIRLFMQAGYRAVWLRGTSLFTHHEPPLSVTVKSWQRLMLPLAGADGSVIRVIVVNMPGPWRPPQETRAI